MTLKGKQNLSRLLHDYMYELAERDNENRKRVKDERLKKYSGVKAQYNHARSIAAKLDTEIEKEILTWWW